MELRDSVRDKRKMLQLIRQMLKLTSILKGQVSVPKNLLHPFTHLTCHMYACTHIHRGMKKDFGSFFGKENMLNVLERKISSYAL